MPGLRTFFKENQIEPDFHLDPFFHIGVGARMERIKIMLQAGYAFHFFSRPSEAVSVARQVNGRYGALLAGYDLANSRNRRFYVNGGVGGLGYEYSVYQRTNQRVPLQDLLKNPHQGSIPSLTLHRPFWEVSVEYSQREKRKQSTESVLRFGYRQGFDRQAWSSDAFQITDAPLDRLSQFFFQATYYFSSNYSKTNRK
ncbi:hypothetical protein ACS5NO_28405 [Larkinella sp. GY13]|uniref:hypothetical protein n=1 Tax=Larkinella sp. GY13 TaxID=3453720 RepID=UPI003EE8A1B8